MIAKVLGYQGIPTTRTVREFRATVPGSEWSGGYNAEGIQSWEYLLRHGLAEERKRTVVDPIYVVPQMLPCPMPDAWEDNSEALVNGVCGRCGGSGVVAPPWPDYIATWQCRHDGADGWGSWTSDVQNWCDERRQVVAYKVTATDPLSVTNDADGQVVWRLHLEALEQPYTEMVPSQAARFPMNDTWSRTANPPAVPLSVPVGEVTDVELAP